MQWKLLVLLAWLLIGGGGCSMGVSLQPAALPSVPLADNGSYVGVQDGLTPQAIRVAVDLSGGRIGAIRVLQHPAWRAPEEQEELLRLVIESQTTEGLLHGTGGERDYLLRAIDDALNKAWAVTPPEP
jgi:uncharacterized protein with FMN-binding domain